MTRGRGGWLDLPRIRLSLTTSYRFYRRTASAFPSSSSSSIDLPEKRSNGRVEGAGLAARSPPHHTGRADFPHPAFPNTSSQACTIRQLWALQVDQSHIGQVLVIAHPFWRVKGSLTAPSKVPLQTLTDAPDFAWRTGDAEERSSTLLPRPVALRSGAFALMGWGKDDLVGPTRRWGATREVMVSLSFPGVLSVLGERALTFGVHGVGR